MSVSPFELAALLGQPRPTEQQAAVTAAEPGPMLVVAGAGAGKTETMASRVVWLVANGLAAPNEVLGLTFTRKAAQQLKRRIRRRLAQLAEPAAARGLGLSEEQRRRLSEAAPTVRTYDSFAGSIVTEYGLLAPVEPGARVLSQAEKYAVADQVVATRGEEFAGDKSLSTVTGEVVSLFDALFEGSITTRAAAEGTREVRQWIASLDPAPRARSKDGMNAESRKALAAQERRLAYLPLVEDMIGELKKRRARSFGQTTAIAATLAAEHPRVGAAQRAAYRVIMLDEYQDTSHLQRRLLRDLFGGARDDGLTVNAVGDPMQGIYGWRGATATNLKNFPRDFPAQDGPAPVRQLTTSFRNPGEVLELANDVSDGLFAASGEATRPVEPLEPFAGNAEGEVTLSCVADAEEEIALVADGLAGRYRDALEEARRERAAGRMPEPFTAAVLVRQNDQLAPLEEALNARGVPTEIVGLTGLLDVPEVADALAAATLVARPQDNAAALRLLAGPAVGLGTRDLLALHNRARHLARLARDRGEDADEEATNADEPAALAKLKQAVREARLPNSDEIVGLGDAAGDLGEATGMSEEGRERVRRVAAALRELRSKSLSLPLTELFTEIIGVLGLRTEVLARADPRSDGAAGTVHLDRLLEYVAGFESIPGMTLSRLLDLLAYARKHDRGLERGEVIVRGDRVQLLTVHKAKGLEWQHVVIPHCTKSWEPTKGKIKEYLTGATVPPAGLSGADDELDIDDLEVENHTDLKKAIAALRGDLYDEQAEEARRLFYVALTRAEKSVTVTAHRRNDKGKETEPFEPFQRLHDARPDAAGTWLNSHEVEYGEGARPAKPEARFPSLPEAPEPGIAEGARLVAEALEEPAESGEDETSRLWERDVTALVDERRAREAESAPVEISAELTASDLVNASRDPVEFARRQRRPVPFKPNSYAKRGTAFHEWVERHFGGGALIDEDELFDPGNADVSGRQLEDLKESFLASGWAEHTPESVELPFEITVGPAVVRGRMDAVFRDPDTGGYLIVDWKTGRQPDAEDRRNAAIQLAVYQAALEKRLRAAGEEAPIRAMFFYVRPGVAVEPDDLPGTEELARRLRLGEAPGGAAD